MGQWLKKNFITIILLLIMFTGICLISYPSVANWWNSFHQSRAMGTYAAKVATLSRHDYDEMLQAAMRYNETLAKKGILWNPSVSELEEYNEIAMIYFKSALY